MSVTYNSSIKKLIFLALAFTPMAGFLVKMSMDGNHLIPAQIGEIGMRFVAVYLPLLFGLAIAAVFLGLMYYHRGVKIEVDSTGLIYNQRGSCKTLSWSTLVVHRSLSSNFMSSTFISDGSKHFRVQRFFWPDYEEMLDRIERTIKHNRGSKTVKMNL